MSFDAAQQIADAVLYEGYALYPYRASSTKNRVRWQFGVIAPREYAERTESDPWFSQTECLVERDGARTAIDVRIRGLQVQARTIDVQSPDGGWTRVPSVRVGERELVEWEEGIERTADYGALDVAALMDRPVERPLELEGRRDVTLQTDASGRPVRIVQETSAVTLRTTVEARESSGLVTVRVRVENVTQVGTGTDLRESALRHALVGTHILLAVRGGRFVSLLDPPAGTADAVAACVNRHVWPVLVGDPERRDLVLSAPIILYDYPAIAPESPGNLFDATEIDEILTLRILTLTDGEKAEARATDARAREVIDRADGMTPGSMARLHGAMRGVPDAAPPADTGGEPPAAQPDDHAWRTLLNPEADAPPESAVADVHGVTIARGSRVVLRPTRRADPMDMFLAGRMARVEGVYHDIEGRAYVAVVLDDDPAGEFHAEMGRFFYYGTEEIEPAGATPGAGEESRV